MKPEDFKPNQAQRKFANLLAEQPHLTVIQSRRSTGKSIAMHTFPPDKYGRWVEKDGTFTYKLNRKGRNRARRRGEL